MIEVGRFITSLNLVLYWVSVAEFWMEGADSERECSLSKTSENMEMPGRDSATPDLILLKEIWLPRTLWSVLPELQHPGTPSKAW